MIDNFLLGKTGRIVLSVILLLVLSGLLCFIVSKSHREPLNLWDEALYANNAMEMVKNGHYMVYTVSDTIDHRNTKPPAVLWMQAASGAALGFSELSVRLPTYLALVGLLALLCFYLYRFTGSILPGLLASLFCLTNMGLIRHHVFLTGDLDGVLVFWTTWITLHCIYCLRKDVVATADYAILTSLFCAGYLTKSTAVLLIVPSLFCMGCYYWQRFWALSASWRFAYSIIAFLAICTSYYLLREHYDPSHWAIVWRSEFTRLTVDVQPWLHFPFSYYFQRFYNPLFQEYLLLLAAVAVPFFLIRRCANKKLVAALLSGAAVYIIFISFPPVKLDWYDAPMYPLVCAAMALIVWELISVGLSTKTQGGLTGILVLTIIVAITAKNSFLHVKEELPNDPHPGQEHQILSDAVKILHDRYPYIPSLSILIPQAPKGFVLDVDELTFYKTVYKWYEGKSVKVSDLPTSFSTGDTLICSREMLDQFAKEYRTRRLDSTAGGAMWILLDSATSHRQ
jgi:4-amino-4-deoxy-L-arabinose transferase-like glycosyltransferase